MREYTNKENEIDERVAQSQCDAKRPYETLTWKDGFVAGMRYEREKWVNAKNIEYNIEDQTFYREFT